MREVAQGPEASPAFVRRIAAALPAAQTASPAVRGRIAAAAQRERSPQLQLSFYSPEQTLDPLRAKNAREQQSCLQVGWLLMPVRRRRRPQLIQSPIAIVV